ncbi:MAG: ribonuclease P protein component [Phycisphaerae bacterium]|jgi:ribonuclease P protein component|nr:ribonuclease P protein component [Phycisphaerae bacterium]
MRHRAGKELRLKNGREISRIFHEGLRARDAHLTLLADRRGEGELLPSRVAAAVSSRHGNAVARNRVKRMCREAFRTSRRRLPAGWDFIMLPRPGSDPTVERLQDSLTALAAKIVTTAERTKDTPDDS